MYFQPKIFERNENIVSGFSIKDDRSFNSQAEYEKYLLKSFKIKKILLNQQHTDSIAIYPGNDLTKPYDAIITKKKNVALILRTADCIPILFYDYKNDIIGAIHAGWQGLHKDIITKTVKMAQDKMGLSIKDTKFVIGPSIRSCCYEVQNDLREKFISKDENSSQYFVKMNNRMTLNLVDMALDELESLKIKKNRVETIEQCTSCSGMYHSYRKNKTELRNLSFISMIK